MSIKTILFVEPDVNALQSMQRSVRDMRDSWRCIFASSASEGLEVFEREPVALVVTNIRMPGMDGFSFFDIVRKEWPDTMRVIWTGDTGQTIGVKALQAASQCLAKPCGITDLKAVVVEMLEAAEQLGSGLISQKVIRLNRLPSLPRLYMKLKEQLDDKTISSSDVADTIRQDPAMATKVLQLANSAYFGGRAGGASIVSVEEAVTRLGIDPIADLALAVEAFSSLNSSFCPNFDQAGLWEHSSQLSHAARQLAVHENLSREEVEAASLAGLLHGLGKLIMAVAMPLEYTDFLEGPEDAPLLERERNKFGSTHAALGAYLGGIWGLPSLVCGAIAHYAEPSKGPPEDRFSPRAALHVASSLLPHGEPVDMAFLEGLQRSDCMDQWKQILSQA